MCAVAFSYKTGKNKTRGFDTEIFVPVYGLCGLVGSPSLSNNVLVGITGNILSVV